jgi:hypothetical protein
MWSGTVAPDFERVSLALTQQTLVRRVRSMVSIIWSNFEVAVSGLAFQGNSNVAKSCQCTGCSHSATAVCALGVV